MPARRLLYRALPSLRRTAGRIRGSGACVRAVCSLVPVEEVEAHYYLKGVPRATAPIVKVLHQGRKPLSSYEISEALMVRQYSTFDSVKYWTQDGGFNGDLDSMRETLQVLVTARYVVRIPGQKDVRAHPVNVYALTHRAQLEEHN